MRNIAFIVFVVLVNNRIKFSIAYHRFTTLSNVRLLGDSSKTKIVAVINSFFGLTSS